MAVKRIAIATDKFIGQSTDTKPTGVAIGSKFIEYDTQEVFICHDGTNWVVLDDSITILKAIQAAVEE